ncbi:ribosomal protein L7/L12, C-terminal/adaptor protein ClpS-like protein [Tribonema minus]|uniref:Ribosomal protein L7/L12, C-terminal/adaptor protein ClpS-like protein n=1 Tax=Tribonema minus TaxID=303371 RepID=A0A835ZHY3_9STRA|nr:ribosomal protein L7/L12, C-terminal/adaptor protein ClpS-like protein [Tribonema minus]
MSKPLLVLGCRVKEKVEDKVQRKEQLDKEKWWRVILHNDDIHTFDYVTLSITKVVKKLTMKIAYEITMETHKAGKATVTQAWKSQAETYCLGLQQCGLTASIAPDSKFGKGGDEGGDGGGPEGGSS